jgi:hypothetical protein
MHDFFQLFAPLRTGFEVKGFVVLSNVFHDSGNLFLSTGVNNSKIKKQKWFWYICPDGKVKSGVADRICLPVTKVR